MARNPLHEAWGIAQHNMTALGALFSQLGDTQHPDTRVLSAYRNANFAMRAMMEGNSNTLARLRLARGIMGQLKDSVLQSNRELFERSIAGGNSSAAGQLTVYGYKPAEFEDSEEYVLMALDVVESKLDAQGAALYAFLYGDMDKALIIGDDERQGVLRPSDVILTGVYWLAALWWDAFSRRVQSTKGAGRFSKQVVAALDHRTTNCCLEAHAQIAPLDGKFHLTGTPRFADYLEWTPFHNRCRSSVVLYLNEYDDGLTERMEESAERILAEKAAGGSGYRWPSSALSG